MVRELRSHVPCMSYRSLLISLAKERILSPHFSTRLSMRLDLWWFTAMEERLEVGDNPH